MPRVGHERVARQPRQPEDPIQVQLVQTLQMIKSTIGQPEATRRLGCLLDG